MDYPDTNLTLSGIRIAQERIRPYVHRTPVLRSAVLNKVTGGDLRFKCENFQKAGVFKSRGAHNAVFSLADSAVAHGVVTHSSGNHGAALALAARSRGIQARVVMPENANRAKVEAVRRYGAEIRFCEPTLAAREAAAREVIGETGAVLVHPYNDPAVMAGQGTAALEFLEECPDLDLLLVPVGGGGLLAGSAVAAKRWNSSICVVAAEPEGADDARRSFSAGKILPCETPDTVADGLRTSLGELCFPHILRHVDDIVTVGDPDIISAMRRVWEVMKIVIEPSAAVPLAAVLTGAVDVQGKRVGILVSGGNVDLDRLPWSDAV